MSVHLLIEITVRDIKSYGEYLDRIPDIVAAKGGRYVLRSSKVSPNSGGWAPDRIILVEFPDRAALKAYFDSPDYAALAPLREAGTIMRSLVIEDEPIEIEA